MKPHPKIDPRLATLLARRRAARVPSSDALVPGDPLPPAPPPKDELVQVLFSYRGDADSLKAAIPGLELGSQRGGIATATLPLHRVRALADQRSVRYVELSRPLLRSRAEGDVSDPAPGEGVCGAELIGVRVLREKRPDLRGAGVVVGMIDSWIDCTHQAFRRGPDGPTRIEALLVQHARDEVGGTSTSTEYCAEAIDAVLRGEVPLSSLVHDSTTEDEHGTKTTSVAAGSDEDASFLGIAPDATIVFVTDGVAIGQPVGSTGSVVDGLRYISKKAGERACVINLCVGDGLGPHDGTSLVERAIDDIVAQPGRAVVIASGDTNFRAHHAEGVVVRGEECLLTLLTHVGCQGDTFEIWYDRPGLLDLEIRAADGASGRFRPFCSDLKQVIGGAHFAVSSFPRSSGRRGLIQVTIEPLAGAEEIPKATFTLALTLSRKGRKRPLRTPWQAWVQSYATRMEFSPPRRDHMTLMTPSSCRHGISVGFHDRITPNVVSPASGRGPTRDGRSKPELIAPGSGIRVARPNPPSGPRTNPYGPSLGASIGAPHVTGAVALIFDLLGPTTTVRTVRAILTACSATGPLGSANGQPSWGLVRIKDLLRHAAPYRSSNTGSSNEGKSQ